MHSADQVGYFEIYDQSVTKLTIQYDSSGAWSNVSIFWHEIMKAIFNVSKSKKYITCGYILKYKQLSKHQNKLFLFWRKGGNFFFFTIFFLTRPVITNVGCMIQLKKRTIWIFWGQFGIS